MSQKIATFVTLTPLTCDDDLGIGGVVPGRVDGSTLVDSGVGQACLRDKEITCKQFMLRFITLW